MESSARLAQSLVQTPPLCIGRATPVLSNAYTSSSGLPIQITGIDSICRAHGSKQPSCLKIPRRDMCTTDRCLLKRVPQSISEAWKYFCSFRFMFIPVYTGDIYLRSYLFSILFFLLHSVYQIIAGTHIITRIYLKYAQEKKNDRFKKTTSST